MNPSEMQPENAENIPINAMNLVNYLVEENMNVPITVGPESRQMLCNVAIAMTRRRILEAMHYATTENRTHITVPDLVKTKPIKKMAIVPKKVAKNHVKETQKPKPKPK